ncbi:Solute carrier family 35 member F6 isoform 1 [Schistosoma japonicum]|uniref:Solute carrier family 35 member F6 isoform 1 n=2 Tax=Schistosoma japonicum TaxID=6182 RepID=A0A4Z2DHK4_SCHJA|nr:Solute carrier family 35 member F6 isoform 1 [Schistosoma japonicum]
MGLSVKQYALIFGMLFSGTINTISKKVQLDCIASGYFNHSANNTRTPHYFNKPWFQTLLMFGGESFCTIAFLVMRCRKKRRAILHGYGASFMESRGRSLVNMPIFNWIFILPTCCDLLGSTLAGIGLLYIDASIWQMLRGSLIVFAGLLSVVFLKRRLRYFQWTGILITVFGLALVGSKSVFSGNSVKTTTAHSVIGLILVLAGAFTSATQMVIEEVFLKKRGFHPLQAVGMEGIFGCILMCGIALPVVHFIPGNDLNGSYENVIDAIYQIGNNYVLLGNCIIYVLSIAIFNYCGLSIARCLSSVHRTLIDSLRTALVWICSLILYYGIGPAYGESFDVGWGLIEVDGFALLIIGTLIHNRVLDITLLPCCPNASDSVMIRREEEFPDRSELSEPYSLDHTDTFDSSDYGDDDDDDAEGVNSCSGGDYGSSSRFCNSNCLSTIEQEQVHLLKPSIIRAKSWNNYSSLN